MLVILRHINIDRHLKLITQSPSLGKRFVFIRWLTGTLAVHTTLLSTSAHASLFKGEALDTAADVLTWVVLVIAPVIAIAIFWLVHILPEKIAEKKHHPQAKAIQTLCILSLFFGGLLWPLAWLWAYTKPVLHQMAYGTDKVRHEDQTGEAPPVLTASEAEELAQLRTTVSKLEARLNRIISASE